MIHFGLVNIAPLMRHDVTQVILQLAATSSNHWLLCLAH